jgi:hypothetical protein
LDLCQHNLKKRAITGVRKGFTPEQIIWKLGEAEVVLGKGSVVADI